MRRIFVDFEMTPVPKTRKDIRYSLKNEIIQIGAVMLDEAGEEISSFDRFVRPEYSDEIPERIVELTGLTTEVVMAEGIALSKALSEFSDWCGEDCTVYSWSTNDLRQFVKETAFKGIDLGHAGECLVEKWTDFQREFSDLLNLHQILRLQDAVYIGGLDFAGRAHDGLIDAKNTAALFVQSSDEALRERFRSYVKDQEESLTASMGNLFDFAALGMAV